MGLKNIATKKETIELSNEIDKQRIPEHIAIIMDGNGRWATKKGLPRAFGHNKGVSVLKEIIKVSKELGCKTLTVYAFSTENWSRPAKEVDFLIDLFEKVINKEINQIHKNSIRINFVGDLTPFPETLKLIITGRGGCVCLLAACHTFTILKITPMLFFHWAIVGLVWLRQFILGL